MEAAHPEPCKALPARLEEFEDDHKLQKAWIEHRMNFFGQVASKLFVGRQDTMYAGVFYFSVTADRTERLPLFVILLSSTDIYLQRERVVQEGIREWASSHLSPCLEIRYYQLTVKPQTRPIKHKIDNFSARSKIEHNNKVMIGQSIGQEGRQEVGSAGCFVLLRDKTGQSLPGRYLLTCHHVVAGAYKFGLTPNDTLKIVSPSETDTSERLQRLLYECSCESYSVDYHRNGLRAHEADGVDSVCNMGNKETLAEKETERRSLIAEMKRIKTFDSKLGDTFWSSGMRYKKVNGTLMTFDWALVKVDDSRWVYNSLPDLTKHEFRTSSRWWRRAIIYQAIQSAKADLTPGSSVAKFGRSTTATFGVISLRRLDGLRTGSSEPHADWWLKGDQDDQGIFSVEGDSGSIIFNVDREALGMIHSGGTEHSKSDISFFTPWKELVEDVFEVAGLSMSWDKEVVSEFA